MSNRALPSAIPLLAAALLLALLQGCGWHLRGHGPQQAGALALGPLHLETRAVGADLASRLRQRLEAAGISLVPRSEAELILRVADERSARRVLSVGAGGKVEAYELQYGLDFSVRRADGTVLIPTEHLGFERDYAFDETEVLAKGQEQRELFELMYRNAVEAIVRRLHNLAGGHED